MVKNVEKKKRIFYPSQIYIVDEDNYIINHSKKAEELAKDYNNYKSTDTVLVAFHISELKKYITKKVSSVVLDFDNNTLTIEGDEGASIKLASTEYEVGVYDLEDEDKKEWQKMVSDAKGDADSVRVVGRPPIAGKYLEYDKDE